MEIVKIVFTGGPCAGKTKLIEKTKKYFTNSDYNVITVPETATILLESGININTSILDMSPTNYYFIRDNKKFV